MFCIGDIPNWLTHSAQVRPRVILRKLASRSRVAAGRYASSLIGTCSMNKSRLSVNVRLKTLKIGCHGNVPLGIKSKFRMIIYSHSSSTDKVWLATNPSVCLCLSQVGVLLKRLNVGSHKQHHMIAHGL